MTDPDFPDFVIPPNTATSREENDEYWRRREADPTDPYHHRVKERRERWAREDAEREA
jgi:hypothetical protein